MMGREYVGISVAKTRCAMLRGALATLLVLLGGHGAFAAEVRIAVPKPYLQDTFLKSLLDAKELAAVGIKPVALPTATEQAATAAVNSGAAALSVFSVAEADRRALQKSSEAALLSQPFLFTSAEEVVTMQKSFLGQAALTDAGQSGLFPLQLWNHNVTYFLTRDPIRSEADFKKLTIATDANAHDVKIISAVAGTAKASGDAGTSSMMAGPVNGFETQLDAATQEFVANYDHKLYLTTGWPVTGVLAAAPNYWLALSEAEKKAWQAAAAAARAASDAEILAREDTIRKNPNIEVTSLDHSSQIGLAKRAAGNGVKKLENSMGLWTKAETEVHSAPRGAPEQAAAPTPRQHANSPVVFVTDRDDEHTLDYATRFGSKRLDPFELTCGVLGTAAPSTAEQPLPPVPKNLTKGNDDCVRLIVEQAKANGFSKALFLIHGFNNDFEYVASRGMKLAADLDYAGVVVLWSWPSEGSAFGYGYDEDSATWSEPHLADLVRDLAEAAPNLQLDFAAHSMGNRILLQMLREFGQAREKLPIGAAIFAAPDVAQDVFKEQIRLARKIANIRTLYASEYDRAIQISESYHKAPRAGSGGADILVTGAVESIDAELSGHSYVFDEPKAIHDFKEIVNQEVGASSRGLEARAKNGTTYWVIEP
jgi:TRAP-type C4-dicarboxylate transport system substrate-binding protein/pimeloyl-ACP methyl ester carboxylesterase